MTTSDLQAALFDRFTQPFEHAGLSERRRRLLVEARGQVLEVGAGTGANLAHYRDVDLVTALEPDGGMAARLRRRVPAATVPVDVVEAGVEDLVREPASFDTVVCTLVLCTVPDLHRALRRIHELLRPDGQLLFLEHVRTPGLWGHFQHLATPMWKTMASGCHLDRDPLGALRETGFIVTDCEHFTMPLIHARVGSAVQGAARISKRAAASSSPPEAGQ